MDTGSGHEPRKQGIAIVVPGSGDMVGVWISTERKLSPRQSQTLIEMVCGAQTIMKNHGAEAKNDWQRAMQGGVKVADEGKWAKLAMMIVAGIAYRVEI